jgi:hypothetical protein
LARQGLRLGGSLAKAYLFIGLEKENLRLGRRKTEFLDKPELGKKRLG